MKVRLAAYLFFVLLFVLGMHALRISARSFREARSSGTSKEYAYALGVVLSAALIVFAVIGVLFVLIEPVH